MAARVTIQDDEVLQLADCPDFTFTKSSPGGDQSASLMLPFTRGMWLPRADAGFVIEDDGTPVWDGFTGPLDPPDLSDCNGNVTLGALGWQHSGPKRGEAERVYGPRWEAPPIAGTDFDLESAVKEAVAALAPDVFLYDANVITTGITLQETENFQGQALGAVLNNLASRTQHLATPSLWHIRQKVFHWRAMDLGARYRIYMANGVKVKPKYDPSRVYDRVIIGWGKDQTAIWPETIGYTKRRQIVDLYLNAGAEVREYSTALSLAQGVYARMQTLSPEWSLDITTPPSCIVEELIDAAWVPISKIRMEPGYVVWIPDLDMGALGPELEVPQGGFMTRLSWQNKTGVMSVSVGEPRAAGALARLARKVVAGGVSPLNLWGITGRDFSTPLRDTAKTRLVGPDLTPAVAPSKPPPVDYRIPATSTEYKTILPEVLPPQPPAFGYQINTPDTTGRKFAMPVEPMVIEKYSLIATKPCNAVIKVTRVSNGATVIPAAAFGGLETRLEVLITPNYTIEKPDHLWIEVTTADATFTDEADWFEITFRSRRVYPGFPGDKAPKTGVRF